MDGFSPAGLERVLTEVAAERRRQQQKFGEPDYPLHSRQDATGALTLGRPYGQLANALKAEGARRGPDDAWDRIALEELLEAVSETDSAKAREEWIQLAAVAVQIVQVMDRRQ